jgi:hypothetical protein
MKPILVNGNGGNDSAFLFRSIVVPYIDGLTLPEVRLNDERYTLLSKGNRTPYELLMWAYSGIDSIPVKLQNLKRMFVAPTSTYYESRRVNYHMQAEEEIDFRKKNEYSYQLTLPPKFTIKEAFEIAVQDLSRFFKVKVSIQTKMVPCLALVHKNNTLKSVSTNRLIYISKDGHSYNFQGITMDELAEILNRNNYELPLIVNKSNIDFKIDIQFTLNRLHDFQELTGVLRSNGISLIESKELIEMVVFE